MNNITEMIEPDLKNVKCSGKHKTFIAINARLQVMSGKSYFNLFDVSYKVL